MTVRIKKGVALGALNITPLIDVVFLLLIFFLVATRFAQEDREMEMPLPSASEAQPLTVVPKELFINIDKNGQYFVNGKILSEDEMEVAIRQASANNPLTQSVIIRADKRVPLQYPVSVGNLCNKLGVVYQLTIEGESG